MQGAKQQPSNQTLKDNDKMFHEYRSNINQRNFSKQTNQIYQLHSKRTSAALLIRYAVLEHVEIISQTSQNCYLYFFVFLFFKNVQNSNSFKPQSFTSINITLHPTYASPHRRPQPPSKRAMTTKS